MNDLMRLRWGPFLMLVAAVFFCVTGCCSVRQESVPEVTRAVRQEIQRRSNEEFREVALWKPAVTDADPFLAGLAPLLLEQTSVLHPPAQQPDVVGTIWASSNKVTLHMREHQQLLYFWKLPSTKASTVLFQGVRITLNSLGEPVVWEILTDTSGAEIIWVAQSVEIAAAAEFGSAFPGRLCSVERSESETPLVVVPDVVDDGPVPMGPILYVSRRGDIYTVACRCSAARAATLIQQGTYRLQTVSVEEAARRLRGATVPIPESWFDPARLQRKLRLPGEL